MVVLRAMLLHPTTNPRASSALATVSAISDALLLFTQQLMQLHCQHALGVGLGKQRRPDPLIVAVDFSVAGIAGRKENPQARPERFGLFCEICAVYSAGHHNVGE